MTVAWKSRVARAVQHARAWLALAVIAAGCTGCMRGCQVTPADPPYEPGTGGVYWETPTAGQGGESGTQPTATGGNGTDPSACRWVPARSSRRAERAAQGRVVHGTAVAEVSRYPFVCAVETPSYRQYCMCVLRDATHCTSAAHCQVEPGDVVHCGTLDLRQGGVRAYVKVAKHHPQWHSTASGSDVAVLELTNAVDLVPAPVAAADYARPVWTVGWGSTVFGGTTVSVLREAEIPLMPWGECRLHYPGLDGTMLCAGNAIAGDACQGDSGGGLFQATASGWAVVGYTSYGNGCAGDDPGVWTDAAAVERWVAACSR